MTATAGTTSGSQAARLAPGFVLDKYRLGQPLWPLRIADAYRAEGPNGPATVYVIHAAVTANPAIRDQVIAGTRAAAGLPEHKHLVKTLAAGLTGDILWIATEEVDGSPVRDLISKKRLTSSGGGLGTRAAGNLITGVTAALADVAHGALAPESVVVSRTGRVRVIDLALGAGTAAAIAAGLVPATPAVAPEIAAGGAPTPASDVYGIGALLYEVLTGGPLERGGPRPSDVVDGVNAQIDELVARACHRDPDKRFGNPRVLGEVVAEGLTQGGAMKTTAVPLLEKQPSLRDEQVSLAAAISMPGMSLAGLQAAADAGDAAALSSAAVTGNPVADRALVAALADSTEKWLIAKGKLDYGPFSLADVIAQIEKGEIVGGNMIVDKDTGARVDVAAHPLLGPMVETARQQREDARRAQAEVAVQSREKKRGVMLYAVIVAGVAGVAAAAYFVIQSARSDDNTKVAGVSELEAASLKITVSEPKKPPPQKRRPGGTRRPGGGTSGANYTKGSEDLALDMSDDGDDGPGSLDMGVVFQTYSRYGGKLGGCLASSGERSADIYINIDGPSGRVVFAKINGKQSGALYGCMNGVLRSMKFPSIKSGRTRAEFDIRM